MVKFPRWSHVKQALNIYCDLSRGNASNVCRATEIEPGKLSKLRSSVVKPSADDCLTLLEFLVNEGVEVDTD